MLYFIYCMYLLSLYIDLDNFRFLDKEMDCFLTDGQDQSNSSVLATLAALAEATAPNSSTQGR